MATMKRGKGARAAGRRKRSARKPAAKSAVRQRTTGGAAKKGAAKRASARPARASKSGARSEGALATLKARFAREKSELEKRLTDSVREIGQLRHHETRVTQLERQLKERDETIGQLRSQLSELRNRPLASVDDEEVQPSLALGSRVPRDLDEFDEDAGPDDEDDELI